MYRKTGDGGYTGEKVKWGPTIPDDVIKRQREKETYNSFIQEFAAINAQEFTRMSCIFKGGEGRKE